MAEEWILGNVSAIVLKENLCPVEGKGSPFFPPTFAPEKKGDPTGYCIDVLKDGTQTCLIDSVGSQANRMEPLFTKEPFDKLVPQIVIKADDESVNICNVGHRAADALLRHSSIYKKHIEPALKDLPHDAKAMAKLNPTALVFGLWDSRGTMIKVPRIVSSVIRAYDISSLTRSAQYTPPVNYKKESMLKESQDGKESDARSALGFQDAPSTNTHGGIIAQGTIQKDTVVNLVALRRIVTNNKEDQIILQKYILGLALVSTVCIEDWYLRQGCHLVKDHDSNKSAWNLVYPDGNRQEVNMTQKDVLAYAQDVAKSFGVGQDILDATFNVRSAQNEIDKKKKEKNKQQK